MRDDTAALAASTEFDESSVLGDLAVTVKRRLPIVVLVFMLVTTTALVYSLKADKQYTATAKLLFRDPGFDQKLFGAPLLAPSQDPNREAATNVSLVELDTIAGGVARALRRPDLTPEEIRKRVQVMAQGQSDLIAVIATETTPTAAAALANTIAREYIRFRRDADRSKINQAARLLRRQRRNLTSTRRDGATGESLRAQIEQLGVLASLQTGNAELVQPARRPIDASAPTPVRNTILGMLLGAGLGVGLALLLSRLDRRLRGRADAEAVLGRPVLAVIPESRALREDSGKVLHLSGAEGEAFRTLRTNMRYYDVDRELRSVIVMSPAPGDGKSTVARYLAATAAASNVRVILVEADLRRPVLCSLFPVLRRRGLTEVLADQLPSEGAIQTLPLAVGGQPDGRSLDVLVAGAPPSNPSDLLDSDRMRNLVAELEARYELVVIDSAPITVAADSVPILGSISGVVIVLREGRSTRPEARALRQHLEHLGITALGVVLNGSASTGGAYYEYYGLPETKPRSAGNGSSNGSPPARRQGRSRRSKAPVD